MRYKVGQQYIAKRNCESVFYTDNFKMHDKAVITSIETNYTNPVITARVTHADNTETVISYASPAFDYYFRCLYNHLEFEL